MPRVSKRTSTPVRSREEATALLEANRGLVHRALRRAVCGLPTGFVRRNWQDLKAQAMLAGWGAALSYDPALGELSTLVYASVRNEVWKLLHRSNTIRTPDTRASRHRHFEAVGRAWHVRSLDACRGGDNRTLAESLGACDESPDWVEHEELLQALRELPARHRRAVELYYRDGLNLTEAGQELGGISRERVRQLLAKAKQRIRETLLVYEIREQVRRGEAACSHP